MVILLWLGCASKAWQPVGPQGLACEGRTAIYVDPAPWAGVQTITVNGQPGPQVVVADAALSSPVAIGLDQGSCTLVPAASGGETGICAGIGIALHYTPLCDLTPTRTPVASTRTFVVDTARRCLPNTASIGGAEKPEHATCGGRPPGDSAEGLPAVPFSGTFPYLVP